MRIVITGISRGLGAAMTRKFIEAGHEIHGGARSAAAIERLNSIYDAPHSFHQVDVSQIVSVRQWAQRVLTACGPPDLLINNAALINGSAPLWEVPNDDFQRVIDTNVKGTFFVIREFLPAMIATGKGVIVNFSSAWGRSVAPEVAPYCASKWAVEGLTRSLAQELPAGLAAIPVNPGIINTEMLQSCFGSAAERFPDAEAWAERAIPYLLQLSTADNGQPRDVPGG